MGLLITDGHSETVDHDEKIFDVIFRDEYANELG